MISVDFGRRSDNSAAPVPRRVRINVVAVNNCSEFAWVAVEVEIAKLKWATALRLPDALYLPASQNHISRALPVRSPPAPLPEGEFEDAAHHHAVLMIRPARGRFLRQQQPDRFPLGIG